ncbi:MAG: hypothetical protein GY698_19255 [Actinomycetia bacterium]|nr:hypothetical protein [Actinomycetes bacterium]
MKAKKEHVKFTYPEADAYVDWLVENEGVWWRGSSRFKERHDLIRSYAATSGITYVRLLAWYENQRDAYKKLKNELGKSGAPRRKLSEHQEWLLRCFRFYDAVIRSDAVVSQPLKNLSRQPEEVESDQEEDQEGGTQDLEAIEHDAALVSTSNPDTSQPPKKKSKKTTRDEDEQALLRELRDSIQATTEIIKTFAPRPPPTN